MADTTKETTSKSVVKGEAEKADTITTYMSTILGQQSPYEISAPSSSSSDDIHTQLLRADSLWNLGRTSEAADLVIKVRAREDWDEEQHGAFARGLDILAKGHPLEEAYTAFVEASNSTDGLEAVFYTERAVNIAFWLACTGKMVNAAGILEDATESTPYAGGILAFAIHMAGASERAETVARNAIAKGFNDPWTIHAVAHSLYSLGRSDECAEWLRQHRSHVQDCSPFMTGHMEFHLGLCLCDLQDTDGLMNLIANGPMWDTMSKSDREDYWNATGLLNLLWKAEIRGITLHAAKQRIEALSILDSSGVQVAKSPVFSLCILRWSTGEFRDRWEKEINQTENQVLAAVAQAVCAVYPGGTEVDISSPQWKEAELHLAPIANVLVKLGASPEQREVIEEFVAIVAKRGVANSIDLREWSERNRRPKVAFYSTIIE